MKRSTLMRAMCLHSALGIGLSALAQTPLLINYQGRLLNGTNLVNGPVGLSLSLYNASSGGTLLYADSNTVPVADGLYSTYLGDSTTAGDLQAALTNAQVWLQVTANGTVLAPRERLASVAYARSVEGLLVTTNNATVLNPGGGTNQALSANSVIGGGRQNTVEANGEGSAIGGGTANTVRGFTFAAAIAGGNGNEIGTNANNAAIGGGVVNTVGPVAYAATIGGGELNRIDRQSADSTIGGGSQNKIGTNVAAATIGGGAGNQVNQGSDYSTLAGGQDNGVATSSTHAVISGGQANSVAANSPYSTIGGGLSNYVAGSAHRSSIGGGARNSISTNAHESAIGGGSFNDIRADAYGSFIGAGNANGIDANYSVLCGGTYNHIEPIAGYSFIGGGNGNTIHAFASESFLGGGIANDIESNAIDSVIGGGSYNSVRGPFGVVPGGEDNIAGSRSFAAGSHAWATNAGSFVWADASTNAGFGTTASNQFLIRASGGVGIGDVAPAAQLTVRAPRSNSTDNTATFWATSIGPYASHIHYGGRGDWYIRSANTNGTVIIQDTGGNVGIGTAFPTNKLHVVGTVQATAYITTSDRHAKKDIAPVDAQAILAKVDALPISTWRFKDEPNGTHLGPMAQDFHAAFGLGNTDSGIFTVDESGVALAAIQALARENAELRKALESVSARLHALEAAR